MAVTYKGMPHRKRRLAPEIKFRAKKKQEPLMIPMQKISKPVFVEEDVLQELAVDDEPIISDSEPVAEKPKKRGRPKKVTLVAGEKDEMF